MYNINPTDSFAIATLELERFLAEQAGTKCPEVKPIKIPQRKAKLHDKHRVRRREVQNWVFRRTGLASTQEVKAALKKLGKHFDLRLTASWLDLNFNWAAKIADIVKKERADFFIGDRVAPIEYTARTAYAQVWSPHYILDIVDGEAVLDMLTFRVPLSNLRRVS